MTRTARRIPLALIVLLGVGAAPLVAQSDWQAVRPTPMVTLEIRKMGGVPMLVPGVTLFLFTCFARGRTCWPA